MKKEKKGKDASPKVKKEKDDVHAAGERKRNRGGQSGVKRGTYEKRQKTIPVVDLVSPAKKNGART